MDESDGTNASRHDHHSYKMDHSDFITDPSDFHSEITSVSVPSAKEWQSIDPIEIVNFILQLWVGIMKLD